MYLRFETLSYCDGAPRSCGIFAAADVLRESGALPSEAGVRLEAVLSWMDQHLKVPPALDQSSNRRAQCWFHAGAKEAITQAWRLVAILREYDVDVQLVKTADPGLIVYRDAVQVVVKPRRHGRYIRAVDRARGRRGSSSKP